MKYKSILPLAGLAVLMATACDDSKMEWVERDPATEITAAEIPLSLAEKIAKYDDLLAYTDLNLGVGVDLASYMEAGKYDSIVNDNFREIVIGYDMKHGAMVNGRGEINFETVDGLVAKAKENGLHVYGHTLVWHTNQNASYLNSLLAPEIIPGPAGSNLLDVSGLEDGSFTGWNRANPGEGITVEEGAGMGTGSNAVKLVASVTSANYWDLQLKSPEIPFVAGHTYQVTFFIRSDDAGQGRISLPGNVNEYPWIDWTGTGSGTESFTTSSAWQQVQFNITEMAEGSDAFLLSFDLGKLPGVTYYIDIDNLSIIDLDAEPTVVNMVANGDFESGLEGWSKYNGPDGQPTLATGGDAFQGEGAMRVEHELNDPGSQWQVQIHTDFTEVLPEGDYKVSYYIRSEAPGSVRCSTTGTARYQGDQATNSTWKLIEWTITSDGAIDGLNFDLGAVSGVYYIDNVVVSAVEAPAGAPALKSATIIEKTDEEKTQLIGEAMESWITAMMAHYKDEVKAWDVLNEPMKENGTLRDGDVAEPADDEFYWVKYLGEDFAVKAFQLAREHGGDDQLLFMNDYNLENPAKVDGFIAYAQDQIAKGAPIDGLGTQMHVSISTSKENIAEMFTKLAATGLLVKVSELDVQVGTTTPSLEQLLQQAEMYQYIVEKYLELVPAEQQYGITVWGIQDPNGEGYWLADDAAPIWDKDYQRKPAYKYFVDGLAGRDVSEDFDGLDYY
ncbi:endo-1,4-beta-xylanase [Geofilum rhodophaeum]|uniref:endo-1,4-beta-xylanase n=1 Tax=Geofilum rhodophaeum TaxID=1965019 RepID=UPI000B51F6B7|nr:endo-1,4-beta-xylanase [Geofilum rhodophaeum]